MQLRAMQENCAMPGVQSVIFTIVCAKIRLNNSDLGWLAIYSKQSRGICKGKLLAWKKSWKLARAFQLMSRCNIHSRLDFCFATDEHCLKVFFSVHAMAWNKKSNQCVWLLKPS